MCLSYYIDLLPSIHHSNRPEKLKKSHVLRFYNNERIGTYTYLS